MNFDRVMQLIGRWGGTLKFFPSDPDARIGIAEELVPMVSSEEQLVWLVRRVPQLHTDWPGVREVRAVFCTKFRPADGRELHSDIYANGIPSETEALIALPAPPAKRIAAGEVSAAPSLCGFVADAAGKNINRIEQPKPRVRDIPLLPPGKRITEDDIARAAAEWKAKRAAAEMAELGISPEDVAR